MVQIRDFLAQLELLGYSVIADGSDLKVTFDEDTLAEELEPVLAEIKRHKSEILAVLTEGKNAEAAMIDGHTVRRIVWDSGKAIDFEDEQGRFWRRLHPRNQTWPVIVKMREIQ
jgi:hypothetical protein